MLFQWIAHIHSSNATFSKALNLVEHPQWTTVVFHLGVAAVTPSKSSQRRTSLTEKWPDMPDLMEDAPPRLFATHLWPGRGRKRDT